MTKHADSSKQSQPNKTIIVNKTLVVNSYTLQEVVNAYNENIAHVTTMDKVSIYTNFSEEIVLAWTEEYPNEFYEAQLERKIKMFNYDDLIGLSLQDAVAKAGENGFTIRTRTKDGQPMMGTCDYQTHRINVATQDGKVVSIQGIG